MEKTNLLLFYQLGCELKPIIEYKYKFSERLPLVRFSLRAHSSLKKLLDSFTSLNVCRTSGNQCIQAFETIFDWLKEVEAKTISAEDFQTDQKFINVIEKATQFEPILLAELQTLDAYHVTQKGIYDTTSLIDNADNTLPPSVLTKLTAEVKREIRESGRCLAFDNATASGFHIMRATECVMHQYLLHVCNPKPKPKERLPNWGAYITEFENSKIPQVLEVAAIIRQIKDRHRNLIMHPEVILTPDEAFTLFEIAQGAIIAMANDLPIKKSKK